MKIPTKSGCYKVHIEDEYGDNSETMLAVLKQDVNGHLYQYCPNNDMIMLTIGFGGYREHWIELSSIDYHIEVQKLRHPK